jgi:hypothetical protein
MPRDNAEISPVRRSKKEARASYNKLSRWYDLLADRYERKYRDAGFEILKVKEVSMWGLSGEIVIVSKR